LTKIGLHNNSVKNGTQNEGSILDNPILGEATKANWSTLKVC